MTRLVSQEIQLKTRFVNALSASLIIGGAALASSSSFAAPVKSTPTPRAQAPVVGASVAGAQPLSAIATSGHSLVARSQPRPKKEMVATRPEKHGNAQSIAANATAKNSEAQTPTPEQPVTRMLVTKPPVVGPAQSNTPVATTVKKVDEKAVLVKSVEVKAAESREKAQLATRAAKAAENKAAEEKAKKERLLLAQLDADLLKTEKRLDTTNQKLSAGQKELMSLTSTLQTVMAESGEDAAGLHPFVRVASRYAGTPYVWGGESRYGFDCSGFIIRVMRDLGYKALPHSAAEQFKYGQPVAQSLLKPGDIVFFANTYKPGISHVGIYIGKRRFIHAASTREGTIISSLDASPYKQKYAGARRLLRVRKSA